MRPPVATANWLALLTPAALLGGALLSEHVGGLVPCEMCLWQRWPHWAALAFAAVAFLASGAPRRILIAIAAGGIATSGLIGVFHAGVEYHWWQGITGCAASFSSGGDIQATLDRIMNAPVIRCDVPQWSLFGVSLAGYNALLSLGSAAAIAALLLTSRRRRFA